MRKKRNPWILLLLILFGALIGGLIGEFLSKYAYFTWMSFGGATGYKNLFAFSLDPAIDFRVIKFGFNVALGINAGSILGMILGILVFLKI